MSSIFRPMDCSTPWKKVNKKTSQFLRPLWRSSGWDFMLPLHGAWAWALVPCWETKILQAMRDSQKVKEKKNPQKQITFCSRDNFISAVLQMWQMNPMSWGQRRGKSSGTVRNNSLPPKQLGKKTELSGALEVK